MKTNKNIYYIIIFLIVVGVFILLWRIYSKPPEITPVSPSQNQATTNKDDGTQIYFASNGKTNVYKIKKDNRWSVIWNGKEGKSYDYVSNPVFSPDGSKLAYSAELDGQAWVVLNNEQEYNAYRKATSLVFSEDGEKLAFVAIKDSTSVVVINGQESRDYQSVGNFQAPEGTTSIIFSPDGTKVVYVITENGKSYIVVNGQEGQAFDDITQIYFNENNQLVYQAQQGTDVVTVVNNQVVSTEPNTGSTNPNPNENNNNPVSSGSTNKNYRYKKATDQDINFQNDPSINYGACQGTGCNF